VKPTTEGDLLKMSDIIPTEEVDDTPLGMLYIITSHKKFSEGKQVHVEGQGCIIILEIYPGVHMCRVSLAYTRHIYTVCRRDQRLRRTEVEA